MSKSDARIRELIAQESARIIISEGIDDFLYAKKKVARRLGFEGLQLPGNEEIERAIDQQRMLFPSRSPQDDLKRVQNIALEAMEFLKGFAPYLVGNILGGYVGKYNDIFIYLPIDSAEELMVKLINNGIPFKETTYTLAQSGGQRKIDLPGVRFLVDGTTVNVYCFPSQLLRKTLNNRTRIRYATLENARTLMCSGGTHQSLSSTDL